MRTPNKRHRTGCVAVIGGGPAGMTAAIFAAREAERLHKSIRILLFEADNKTGKKILATGNGRCNLSNQSISAQNYYGAINLFEKVSFKVKFIFF